MNDLISRQAAVEHIKNRLYETELNSNAVFPYYAEMADNRVDVWLNELPTIEPKHGKWTLIERREPQFDLCGTKTWAVAYRCSECGFIHTVIEDFGHYAFCPNCGARMERSEK